MGFPRMYYGKLNNSEDKCKIKYPHDFPDFPCKKCNSYYTINLWVLYSLVIGLLITLIFI